MINLKLGRTKNIEMMTSNIQQLQETLTLESPNLLSILARFLRNSVRITNKRNIMPTAAIFPTWTVNRNPTAPSKQ